MVSQGLFGFSCVAHTGVSEPQLARESLKPGTCWQNSCYLCLFWMTRFPFSLVDVYTRQFYSPVF